MNEESVLPTKMGYACPWDGKEDCSHFYHFGEDYGRCNDIEEWKVCKKAFDEMLEDWKKEDEAKKNK